jgi:hypothetical protein
LRLLLQEPDVYPRFDFPIVTDGIVPLTTWNKYAPPQQQHCPHRQAPQLRSFVFRALAVVAAAFNECWEHSVSEAKPIETTPFNFTPCLMPRYQWSLIE